MKKLDIGGKLKNSVKSAKANNSNSNGGGSSSGSENNNGNGDGLLKKIKSGLGEWVDEGAGVNGGGNGGDGELAKVKDDLVVKVHVPGAPEGVLVEVGIDQVHRVWEDPQGPRLILIVDETNELMMPTKLRTEAGKEEDSQKAEIGMIITSLTQLGRSSAVNCLLATQRASVDAVPGVVQNNSLSLDTKLRVKRKPNIIN